LKIVRLSPKAKSFLASAALCIGIAAMFVLEQQDGPPMLAIDSNGISVVDLAKNPWDRVCFYPQFSFPEELNGEQSYSQCKIWNDVEERNVLIVFSFGDSCESFGAVGDFLGPYFEEHRCFSASEVKQSKLVNRSGVIKLEN
jgi:hypothetical protein